jgi:hypothetical protein
VARVHQPAKLKLSNEKMARPVKEPVNASDLDAEATAALEKARNMPPGPARTEALKKAGLLRKAADLRHLSFAKRGRPRK